MTYSSWQINNSILFEIYQNVILTQQNQNHYFFSYILRIFFRNLFANLYNYNNTIENMARNLNAICESNLFILFLFQNVTNFFLCYLLFSFWHSFCNFTTATFTWNFSKLSLWFFMSQIWENVTNSIRQLNWSKLCMLLWTQQLNSIVNYHLNWTLNTYVTWGEFLSEILFFIFFEVLWVEFKNFLQIMHHNF